MGVEIGGHALIAGGRFYKGVYYDSGGGSCVATTVCIRFGPGVSNPTNHIRGDSILCSLCPCVGLATNACRLICT
jgi:hypothetical protein